MKAGLNMDGRDVRLILCALAFALIVINGVLAFAYVSELHNAVARVNRSLQVVRALKEIEDLVEESVQDQWIYRIYGDAQRLDSYRKAQSELPTQLRRLRDLVVDE